ncbi:MAG: 3-methyl-2-oxobutanoate dehydrogenase subunit VorB [Desulfovibrionaceae bacterium]
MSQERILIKGNDAIAFGAVDAGCRCYFGYPITPQNEIPESLSSLLPAVGGQFVQAESEVGSINMVMGAGACGIPAMTSSSSCGISLMQEGISYMAGSHVPGVVVNMVRGGPGLGDIGPSQGDYFQAVKGGGHGDYRCFVIAPATAQECYDMMFWAFESAFKYRNPVLVLGDAIVGQIKEPVLRQPPATALGFEGLKAQAAAWRVEGYGSRGQNTSVAPKRLLKSVYLADGALAKRNELLMEKYAAMHAEAKALCLDTEDADLVIVAYGSIGRIAQSAQRMLRAQGHKIGIVRPLTLYPFPSTVLEKLAARGKRFLVIEQNTGQMVEDVRLAVRKYGDAQWHGIMPGLFIGADTLLQPIVNALKGA